MSEFKCVNGHDMLPSQGPKCTICGCRVGSMDGMSEKELKGKELAEQAQGEDQEEGGEQE